MLERLLTQETRFLRYPGLFTAFEQHVLPEMQAPQILGQASSNLRIWSAGCASGEEPYSIAMSICDGRQTPHRSGCQHHGHRHQPRGAGARRPRPSTASACWKIFPSSQIATYFTQQDDTLQGEAGSARHGEVCAHEPGAAGLPRTLRLHLLHERPDLLWRGVALQADSALSSSIWSRAAISFSATPSRWPTFR